ncbi:DUF1871 family protein [Bacillus sp. 2205SS5-2]|uniref:DUF1871 family protein n=1 Tax=Bacillus sp. 2205SS5-2 TaxID=3109031 RepID=UPI003003D4D9
MNLTEMNRQLVSLLKKWDPFQVGPEGYDTEIADVVQAVHDNEKPQPLAGEIQSIYEFSFEEWIPMWECEVIAEKMLQIKNSASCSF